MKKKLAASNSSLEQSVQRNEQLSGKLARANQRNKTLINNLKQERHKANLNSPAHQIILEAIYSENSAKTDRQKRECLEKLKETSISLGEEYQRTEIKPILDVIPKALATYFFTEESVHSLNSVKFIWVAVAKK